MILYDSTYLKIEFRNVPCRHLVANWTGSPDDEMYKHGCKRILRCCHENDIRKLLSDIRLRERISDTAEHLAETAIKEYVAQHGRFFHAVVLSNEVFVKFSVINLDRGVASNRYVHQYFANQQDALAWLEQADA